MPRDEGYYGDPGTHYTYSRREYKPLPWTAELLSLKTRVEEATPVAAYTNLSLPNLGYNAVLCNLYRDGNDSVGLHADAEPEMGPVNCVRQFGCKAIVPAQTEGWKCGLFGKIVSREFADHGWQHAEKLQT